MSQQKLHRKDIKQPDVFQTTVGKGLESLRPHFKTIAAVAAVVVFGGAAVWAVQLRSTRAQEHFNRDYAAAIKTYEENVQNALVDEPTDWAGVLAKFDALYAEASGNPLQPMILQYMVNTYIEMGNFDAASGAVADLIAQVGDKPEMLVVALYSKAKILELKGDRAGAQAAYNDAGSISPNPLGEFLESEAKRANSPMLPKAFVDRYLAASPAQDAQE